jgi:hypothetical protein
MAIRNKKDFWAGVMFIVTGMLFMAFSQQYQMGTAAKMGPAYFPTVLGGLMAVLGLMLAVPAVRMNATETRVEPFRFKVIGTILAAVAAYALTLPTLGFIVSLFLLVVIASLASHEFSWKSTLISAVVLLIGSWLVFVKGLELQFPFLPVFLTR